MLLQRQRDEGQGAPAGASAGREARRAGGMLRETLFGGDAGVRDGRRGEFSLDFQDFSLHGSYPVSLRGVFVASLEGELRV